MGTHLHSTFIQKWFGNIPPTHYLHDGQGTAWYVFRNGMNDRRYLIMLSDDDGPLRAVGIADNYGEVTDLYNMVKAHNPDARWVH